MKINTDLATALPATALPIPSIFLLGDGYAVTS